VNIHARVIGEALQSKVNITLPLEIIHQENRFCVAM
jgi:hypothetical protein